MPPCLRPDYSLPLNFTGELDVDATRRFLGAGDAEREAATDDHYASISRSAAPPKHWTPNRSSATLVIPASYCAAALSPGVSRRDADGELRSMSILSPEARHAARGVRPYAE